MTSRRNSAKNEAEIMSRNHSKVVRSWSSTHYLVEELDALARDIKTASNVHCDRSKLLNALAELVIEHRRNLDLTRIVDQRTLIDELAAMLKKK